MGKKTLKMKFYEWLYPHVVKTMVNMGYGQIWMANVLFDEHDKY